MGKKIPLIRLSQINPFIKTLEQIGSPYQKLLQKSHIPIYFEDKHNHLIPEYLANLFLEKATQLEGETFGLLTAQYSDIEDLGMIGNLLSKPATLSSTLHKFLDYVRWHSTDALFWLKIEPLSVWFCRQGVKSINVGLEPTELYTVGLMIKIIQSFMGSQWKPDQIYLQMNPKKNLSDDSTFKNVPIFFQQPFTAIVFPRNILWQTRSVSAKKQTTIEQNQDISKGNLIVPNTEITEAVQQIISTFLPDKIIGINQIAKITGISSRTLQRELAKQNTSYSHLLQEVRLQQALELLKNSSLKLIEIADLLGYSDASHFSRAFKKWTGFSPFDFRRMFQEKIKKGE